MLSYGESFLCVLSYGEVFVCDELCTELLCVCVKSCGEGFCER